LTALPLAGRTVVVTRAAEQARGLTAALRAAGAAVVEVPVISVADPVDGGAALAEAVAAMDRYDWVVVTSPNGARRLLSALGRAPAAPVAVIGPGTAEALRAGGGEPALVPPRAVAEGLLEVFPPGGGRVLLAQAEQARPVLADGLRAAGWDVDAVVAYRTVPAAVAPDQLDAVRRADAITFTSGSTVRNFLAAAGSNAVAGRVVCIGPETAAAARRAGLAVTAVATEHTLAGLVEAVIGVLSPA
jgi:uroporphyrinogen-III synthase